MQPQLLRHFSSPRCAWTAAAICLVAACSGKEHGSTSAPSPTGGDSHSVGVPETDGFGGAGGTTNENSAEAGTGETAGGGAGTGAGGETANVTRARVVDLLTKRPLRERKVVISSTASWSDAYSTQTDADGFFELRSRGAAYRAVIVDPDGSAVSVYDRLTSAGPVLVHRSSGFRAPPSGQALVKGTLSGGASYPLSSPGDIVVLHLLSAETVTSAFVSGAEAPFGPGYLMQLGFGAKETATATLLAVGTFADPGNPEVYTAAVGKKDLELRDGDEQAVDIQLESCPLVHLAGEVQAPAGYELTDFSTYYRFPTPDSLVDFPLVHAARVNPFTQSGTFDYELPDLRSFGGTLCASAFVQGQGALYVERCESDNSRIELRFDAAPVLSAPAAATELATGTVFEWSSASSGVVLLKLDPDTLDTDVPQITLFTAERKLELVDLSAAGIELPKSVAYHASVSRLGSYASLDEATATNGLGSVAPSETRTSSSLPVDLVTAP